MDGVGLVAVAARHEPGLERERPRLGLDERPHRVVGGGQERRVEPERHGDPDRRLAQRHARAEQLRADEVQAEVAIAEPEPGLAAELGHRLERTPALVGAPPPSHVVGAAGERVEDAVEVGRHVQPEQLDVVRHVAYDGNVAWIDDSHHAAQEPRAPNAARKDSDVHAADCRSSEARIGRPCLRRVLT